MNIRFETLDGEWAQDFEAWPGVLPVKGTEVELPGFVLFSVCRVRLGDFGRSVVCFGERKDGSNSNA